MGCSCRRAHQRGAHAGMHSRDASQTHRLPIRTVHTLYMHGPPLSCSLAFAPLLLRPPARFWGRTSSRHLALFMQHPATVPTAPMGARRRSGHHQTCTHASHAPPLPPSSRLPCGRPIAPPPPVRALIGHPLLLQLNPVNHSFLFSCNARLTGRHGRRECRLWYGAKNIDLGSRGRQAPGSSRWHGMNWVELKRGIQTEGGDPG